MHVPQLMPCQRICHCYCASCQVHLPESTSTGQVMQVPCQSPVTLLTSEQNQTLPCCLAQSDDAPKTQVYISNYNRRECIT